MKPSKGYKPDSGVRVPPQNVEAEQYVLGAILQSKEALEHAMLILKQTDFYREVHRTIYATIISLYTDGAPVEIPSLVAMMKNDDTLERCGGVSYITEIVMSCPTPGTVEYYAGLVKEASDRRSMIACLSESVGKLYSNDPGLAEVRSGVLDYLTGTADSVIDVDCETSVVALQLFTKIQDTSKGIRTTHFKTGIDKFDEIARGIETANLSVIAAMPKCGKSNFMIQAACNMAEGGTGVGYIALDIHRETVLSRMLTYSMKIPPWIMFSQQAPLDNITEQMKVIGKWPIKIAGEENCSRDPMRIIQWITMTHRKFGLKVYFVDSFSMFEARPEKWQNEESYTANVVNKLQSVAKQLDIAIFGAVDLNYEGEAKGSSRWRAGASNIYNFELAEDRKSLKVKSKYIRNGPPVELTLYPEFEFCRFLSNPRPKK